VVYIHAQNAPELSINDLITLYATKYDVSRETLKNIINCESDFNPKAIGDFGTSYGLVQIHLVAHPDISKADAYDPIFSIDYLAKSIKNGKGNQWTCFKSIS
jgi:soluble lytic murein transglycosylase-like protein